MTISAFLTRYIEALSEKYEVHLITSMEGSGEIFGVDANVKIHDISIARAPSIFQDLKSLWALRQCFNQNKFDVVHSVTPKAGLLTQISAFGVGIKYRLHTFTGQVWVTRSGLSRLLFKYLDKLTATLATYTLVDSPSQRDFLLSEGVINSHKSNVLGDGSISGVNLNKFTYNPSIRQQLRTQYALRDGDIALLFVGRLNKEKGVPELLQAFEQLPRESSAQLFFIGSDEGDLSSSIQAIKGAHFLGFQTNISDFYSFADLLVLPSHREGFGNVIIEAAACKLPALASDIYGLSDAVENHYSGVLHEAKSVDDILRCLTELTGAPEQLTQMGNQAFERVSEKFSEPRLVKAFLDFYQNIER